MVSLEHLNGQKIDLIKRGLLEVYQWWNSDEDVELYEQCIYTFVKGDLKRAVTLPLCDLWDISRGA